MKNGKGDSMAEEKKVRSQIHFRITPEEAAIIEQKAEAVNLSPTMYAKKMAVQGKVKPQVISRELGQAMLPHISHMGSNINQLAKKANEGGTVAAAELAGVKAEFEALWDLVLSGKKPPKKHKSEEQKLEEATGQTRLETEEKQDEAYTCPMCGSVAVRRHSDKHDQDYWICPNYSREEKGHLFKWVE